MLAWLWKIVVHIHVSEQQVATVYEEGTVYGVCVRVLVQHWSAGLHLPVFSFGATGKKHLWVIRLRDEFIVFLKLKMLETKNKMANLINELYRNTL